MMMKVDQRQMMADACQEGDYSRGQEHDEKKSDQ
jgi:hypothetical protein